MLKLTNITLMAIDCVHPERTLITLHHSMQMAKFAEVILVTDLHRFPIKEDGIRTIHRKQRDLKQSPPGMPYLSLPVDYEMDVLRLPAEIVTTPFMLHQEWDSCVMNPMAWTLDFLNYDYIGAPWPHHEDPGWPKCDDTNNVGNGGFALKSYRFINLIREAADKHRDDPGIISSDRWQCRTMRTWMESRGIKYAPYQIAERFSCEGRIYAGQFGAHGKNTFEMNGWGGWFKNIRPPPVEAT